MSRRSLETNHPLPGETSGSALSRYGVWILVAAGLVVLPMIFNSGLAISTMCVMGTMIIFALSYNMLLGQTGLLSFGHAVFFGLGGFFTANVINGIAGDDVPIPLMIFPLVGALAGLAFGIIFGAVATRRSGTAFAMITLGIGELVASSALILHHFFGGEEGVTIDRTDLVTPFGITFGPQLQVYYLIAAWCLISMIAMYALTCTPFGRIANAVRDNPQRVRFVGYSTTMVRFLAFSMSGLFAGIAGGLAAVNFEIVNAAQMGAAESGAVILMTYIGGVGNFAGPIIGAIVVTYLQLTLSDVTNVWQLYLGLLFIATVMYAPNGIAGALAAQAPLWRKRRLGKVLPFYAMAFVPGMFALAGLSMIIEMTYQLSVSASEGSAMTFLHVSFNADDPVAWILAIAILGAGSVAFLRAARRASDAYAEALAERSVG